jgi:copper oxidase (laccase) domain-containing protein
MQEVVRKEALDKGMVILKNSNDDAEQRTRELLNNTKDYTTIPSNSATFKHQVHKKQIKVLNPEKLVQE